MECCGILLADKAGSAPVTRALRGVNAAADPKRRYVLGARTHIQAVGMEATNDAHIVGYYHSHPEGGCGPTPRDAEDAVPGICYLIVGLGNGPAEFGVWRKQGDRLTAESLDVRQRTGAQVPGDAEPLVSDPSLRPYDDIRELIGRPGPARARGDRNDP